MKTLENSFHFSSILWRSMNNPLRVAEKDIFYWSFYTWLCWSQTDLKPRSWIRFYILAVFQLWIFRSTTFSKKYNFLKNSRYFFSIVNCFVWWWDLQYSEWFILICSIRSDLSATVHLEPCQTPIVELTTKSC